MIALRDPWYQALFAIQDILYHASIDYFRSLGYKYSLVPATTNSISSPMDLGSDSQPVPIKLFGTDTYLVDSMQFSLEYLIRLGGSQNGMYYIGSVSRGEDPDATHLNQFIHVECELLGGMTDAIAVAEGYVMSLIKALLKEARDHIANITGTLGHLKSILANYGASGNGIPRITLAEALDLPVLDDNSCWKYIIESDPDKGRFLTREGERALMKHFKGPVWVIEPYHLGVAFYQAYADQSRGKARCADLLLGCGEILGLGERHMAPSETQKALELHGVETDEYDWYVQMRREAPVLTSGFGIGIERFLLWVLQHDDIRDIPIIPRLKGSTFFP
jgi:beta-aspartyl-peptidase (threonine type)